MQKMFRNVLLVAVAGSFSLVMLAHGQDEAPSMGDVARQARQQKQGKDTQGKTTAQKAPKVITNEEIPESPEAADGAAAPQDELSKSSSSAGSEGAKLSAEQWKSQIRTQKEMVATLQSNIEKVNASIQFAPGNCVAGCVQWNEHQKLKQQEVERARAQLETQKKRLGSMQESARKQGYGSAVYDP
jgi:hypothetical protein